MTSCCDFRWCGEPAKWRARGGDGSQKQMCEHHAILFWSEISNGRSMGPIALVQYMEAVNAEKTEQDIDREFEVKRARFYRAHDLPYETPPRKAPTTVHSLSRRGDETRLSGLTTAQVSQLMHIRRLTTQFRGQQT